MIQEGIPAPGKGGKNVVVAEGQNPNVTSSSNIIKVNNCAHALSILVLVSDCPGITSREIQDCLHTSRGSPKHKSVRQEIAREIDSLEIARYLRKDYHRYYTTSKARVVVMPI